MGFEHKQVSVSIIVNSLFTEQKTYKRVAAVMRDGVVIRRAHNRNYRRLVAGGFSLVDMMRDNITKNNSLFRSLTTNIYGG